jgi:hypothetical protein
MSERILPIRRKTFVLLTSLAVFVGFAAAVGTVALTGAAGSSSGSNPAAVPQAVLPDLGVLHGNAPRGNPPSLDRDLIPNPSQAREAFTRNGNAYYVAPGRTGRTCLVVVGAADGITTNCAVRGGASQAGNVLALGIPRPDGTLQVVAVVPDGYDSAATGAGKTAVVNNVVVVDLGTTETSFLLSGPAGQRTVPVGWLRPPNTVTLRSSDGTVSTRHQ